MSRFYSQATYLSREVNTHQDRMKAIKAISLVYHCTHFSIYIFEQDMEVSLENIDGLSLKINGFLYAILSKILENVLY